jgi:hypothetical protein
MALNPKVAKLFAEQMAVQIPKGHEAVAHRIGEAVSEHSKRNVLRSSSVTEKPAKRVIARLPPKG